MPLPEKFLRNKCIVALYMIGTPKRQISQMLGVKRRNVYMFLKRDTYKYAPEIVSSIYNFLLKETGIKVGDKTKN